MIIRSPQNRYVYIAWRLLVSYLVGLGLSAIGIAFGFWALLANGVSYSQKFSTVLRTTRHAQMDIGLTAEDTKGIDPLPKHIAKAMVRFETLAHGNSDVELKQRRVGDGGAMYSNVA